MKVLKYFLTFLLILAPAFCWAESNLNDPQYFLDVLSGDSIITPQGTIFEGFASGIEDGKEIKLDLGISSGSAPDSKVLFTGSSINNNGNFSILVPNVFVSDKFNGTFSSADKTVVVNTNQPKTFVPCRDLNYVVCTEGPTKVRGTSVVMKGTWWEKRNPRKDQQPCAYGFMYFPLGKMDDANTRCVYEKPIPGKPVKSFQAKLDKMIPDTAYYVSATAYYKCDMPFDGSHLCADEKKYLQPGDRMQGNYDNVKTAPLKIFIEDINANGDGLEIYGSIFGYDLGIDDVKAGFLLKKIGENGPWDIKSGITLLPEGSYRDPKWKQGKNLFRGTVTGLQPDQLYYVRPYADNGTARILWETIPDPKAGTSIGRIDILTDDSVKPNVSRAVRVIRTSVKPFISYVTVKKTINQPLTYSLNAAVISKAENYWYWFKISDGKQEYCTNVGQGLKTGGEKDGIGYFATRIGVSQYLYACGSDGVKTNERKIFTLKENTIYTVTAYAKNSAGYHSNAFGTLKVEKILPTLSTRNTIHFYQYDCNWGEVNLCPGGYKPMSLVGCGETSFAMILNYWWMYDPTFKAAWNKQSSDPPDPETVFRWEQRQRTQDCLAWNRDKLVKVLGDMGLCVKDVTYNDPEKIQKRYIDRGIPLMMHCRPSNRTGGDQHIVTLLGFLSSPNGNTITKYAPRLGEYRQYLNNMLIHDSGNDRGAFYEMTTGAINVYGSRCGYQYDELPEDTARMERGLHAFYPCYFNQFYTDW